VSSYFEGRPQRLLVSIAVGVVFADDDFGWLVTSNHLVVMVGDRRHSHSHRVSVLLVDLVIAVLGHEHLPHARIIKFIPLITFQVYFLRVS